MKTLKEASEKYAEKFTAFVEDYKKDFPDMIHLQIVNNAEIKRRKAELGL